MREAALSVQPLSQCRAYGWWHDQLRLLWFHLKVVVFFGHDLLYQLCLSLFLPLSFSSSLFLFLSLQHLPLLLERKVLTCGLLVLTFWLSGSNYSNNCLAMWRIQQPISSCSVILNCSVLKWQTCDLMSDWCVLCREKCHFELQNVCKAENVFKVLETWEEVLLCVCRFKCLCYACHFSVLATGKNCKCTEHSSLCKSLILIMLYVVLVAVLHFAGYMRYFGVWVCGFVNCVKCFNKTSLVCKIVF